MKTAQFLIITNAGKSTRFNESIFNENGVRLDANKSLYPMTFSDTCLSIFELQIKCASEAGFDYVVVVGGHRFDQLSEYVDKRIRSRYGNMTIVLVNNVDYATKN